MLCHVRSVHARILKTCTLDDENIVTLQHTGDVTDASGYINASKIHDSDLRQVAYVVTQGPMENTVADYWQMVRASHHMPIVNTLP